MRRFAGTNQTAAVGTPSRAASRELDREDRARAEAQRACRTDLRDLDKLLRDDKRTIRRLSRPLR